MTTAARQYAAITTLPTGIALQRQNVLVEGTRRAKPYRALIQKALAALPRLK